ncbi:MAG: hypothetical protein KDK71_00950 [Chlamydiia bacterium]|nr:hypothetical protein [Chlamydiia bacterium]MCB9092770.1 hypothetical protein [Halobacteriovoraceae bacterium]
MILREDVRYIESRLDQVKNVEELRALLIHKDLKLVVVLLTNNFSCLEWNITQKQVCKVLDLGLRIRVSKISNESESIETIRYEQLCVKETNWEDLDSLFEILKRGMKQCLRNIDK